MFEHTLVPLDGSPLAGRVLPHTVAVARLLDPGSNYRQCQSKPIRLVEAGPSPADWRISKGEAGTDLNGRTADLHPAGTRGP